MITWRGISYLLLTSACYLILAYTGFRLLAVLLPVLLLLPLLSAIQLGLAARRLKFSQRLEPGVTEREDQVRLIATLQQSGWLSHGELELMVVTPGRSGRVLHERRNLPLLAGTCRDVVFTVDCPHRGFYETGLVTLRSRDLFGLFYLPVQSRRKARKMSARLAILPQSQQTAPFADLVSSLSDWLHQQTPEYGDEIDAVANIRAHRPGDSMKRTHWKLSARLDKIMIKEFEKPVQRAGLLLLDMARSAQESRRRSPCLDFGDYFTDQAAYLIRLILETGNRLRLVAYQDQGRHEQSVEHPADLRQAQLMLAGLDWTDRWPAGPALAEETSSDKAVCFVVLMTTRIDDEMAGNLLALQGRDLPVWLVLLRGPAPLGPDQEITLHKLQNTGLPIALLDFRQQPAMAADT